MDDEAQKEAPALPKGLAEKALTGKSEAKTVVQVVLLVAFLSLLGIHFYTSRMLTPRENASKQQTKADSPVYPDLTTREGRDDPGYAALFHLLPLEEGRSWSYTNIRTKQELTGKLDNVVTCLETREIRGQKVHPLKYDIERYGFKANKKAVIYLFYSISGDGVAIFARQTKKDTEPRVAREPIYVLKNPIKVGTSWKNRMNEGVIESVDETVTVPAGTFHNCIRVKLTYRKSVALNWLAPGVGYVKKIFLYKNGGKAVEQLNTYTK